MALSVGIFWRQLKNLSKINANVMDKYYSAVIIKTNEREDISTKMYIKIVWKFRLKHLV